LGCIKGSTLKMSDQTNSVSNFQLEGQQVTLKFFVDSNITPEYIGWLKKKALMQYSNQRFRSHNMASCLDYLNSFKGTDNLFLAIYHGAEFIGTMTGYVSKNHKTADMGLLIGDKGQGKGLGSDAWATLMKHLFQEGARKVTGGTLRCNVAMIKIMVKSGMKPDGVRVAHELVNGRTEDILYFAKFRTNV
jgi:RimJ/RimL family protein N-acetyltransferase